MHVHPREIHTEIAPARDGERKREREREREREKEREKEREEGDREPS